MTDSSEQPKVEWTGPPWARYRRGRGWWRQRGPVVFVGLAIIFGVFVILILASVATALFLLSRLLAGEAPQPVAVSLAVCGAALLLPALAFVVARFGFRGIALPLADLMSASDAVARGDLSARVPVRGRGGFAPLTRSFNHMAEELERADQQRRNLTADVAHELRTPLHVIQGNLEGVLDGVYAPTTEHIEATLSETRLLARLVDDLNTLALAEAGRLPLTKAPVDVADLLADVATGFGPSAQQAGIDLRVETAAGDPALTITADAGRLDQVLGNLVANALRHTPPGGCITLCAVPLPDGVRVTVADTGEGIPPADLPYIFDRFWRGDPSRSHARGAGSGLGLAIARELIAAHGGSIAAQSEVGHGTTFTIDLPRDGGSREDG
ncbi:MAG: HAMP domain-containing sensor histidine kinase [Anaerolineae bacterium]